MNAKDREYAVGRLRGLQSYEHMNDIKGLFTTPARVATPTQKWDLVLAGKVPLKQPKRNKKTLACEAFPYTTADLFDWEAAGYPETDKLDVKGYEKVWQPFVAKVEALIDQVRLGQVPADLLDQVRALDDELAALKKKAAPAT